MSQDSSKRMKRYSKLSQVPPEGMEKDLQAAQERMRPDGFGVVAKHSMCEPGVVMLRERTLLIGVVSHSPLALRKLIPRIPIGMSIQGANKLYVLSTL